MCRVVCESELPSQSASAAHRKSDERRRTRIVRIVAESGAAPRHRLQASSAGDEHSVRTESTVTATTTVARRL